MNKKQSPQTARARLLEAFAGKLSSARYWVVAALIALCLISFKATAFGQVACLNECQQTMILCIQNAQGDPLAEARCQDKYDDCTEGCLID